MLARIRAMSARQLFYRFRTGPRTLLVLMIFCAGITVPGVALPELRPLVRDMLESLGAIDDIGLGLALDDFGRVGAAAPSGRPLTHNPGHRSDARQSADELA